MSDLMTAFDERVEEIDAYLELLDAFEKLIQSGTPRLGEDPSVPGSGTTVTVQQQRVLYASVYLQLYNLVESTMSNCIDAVPSAVASTGTWMPGDLCEDLRREWVRAIARTHTELNYDHRLKHALELCQTFVDAIPVQEFNIAKGAGGNWDDTAIQNITRRIGMDLEANLSADARRAVKERLWNAQGSLTYIKNLRNKLAHGSLSFADCGSGITVADLRKLKDAVILYLREMVLFFEYWISRYEFLLPDRRPVVTPPT